MARKKIKAVTRALSSTSLKKTATVKSCRREEMSESTEHEVADDDRDPEETNEESNEESHRDSMKEVSDAGDTKSGSSHQLEGIVNTKGILKNDSRRRSNSISLQNSLMWSDDDLLTVMSSITRESYSLQSKSVGGKWLDFIESRVIPSPFCRLACGDVDDASQYGSTQLMEWKIPGVGGCDIAID